MRTSIPIMGQEFCAVGSKISTAVSYVAGSPAGAWKWGCKTVASPSNETACIAYEKINGSCGSSHGGSFLNSPGSNLCGDGSWVPVSFAGTWNWTCAGKNGGSDASCYANRNCFFYSSYWGTSDNPKQCGVILNMEVAYNFSGKFDNAINSNVGFTYMSCDNGTISSGGGECHDPIPGVCGSANGQSFPSAPTSNLCQAGTASASGAWSWSCLGQYGGAAASCSATQSGCGSSNGQYFLSAPTANFCSSGTASAVSGSGPWSWTCSGTSCSANKKYTCGVGCSSLYNNTKVAAPYESADASCATFLDPPGIGYVVDCTCHSGTGSLATLDYSSCTTPTLSLTASPTSVDQGGSSTISWLSTNTASCRFIDSYGSILGWAPDPAAGSSIFSGITVPTTYNMECLNSSNISIVNQSVTVGINSPVDGVCGSYSNPGNDYLFSPPSSADPVGLCGDGSTPAVSGSGPWSWTCNGKSGGSPASCTAKKTCIPVYSYICPMTSTGAVCNTTDKAGKTITTAKPMCAKTDTTCGGGTTYPANADCGVPCSSTSETLYCPLPISIQKWQETAL
ncbi:MAG: hypothetical protein WCI36_01660 [bacterium]